MTELGPETLEAFRSPPVWHRSKLHDFCDVGFLNISITSGAAAGTWELSLRVHRHESYLIHGHVLRASSLDDAKRMAYRTVASFLRDVVFNMGQPMDTGGG